MNEQSTYVNPASAAGKGEEEEISLVELFWKYIRYWKWIVLGVVVALLVAGIYLYFATPVYKVTSSVILKDVQSAQKTPALGTLDELALLGAVNNVEDEAFVMKSKAVVQAEGARLDPPAAESRGGGCNENGV